MSRQLKIAAAAAAALLCAGIAPATAWDQLDLGSNSAGQPTYAPEGQGTGQLKFKDLPGVQLNPGQQASGGDCTQSRFYSSDVNKFGAEGNVTECNFGKFSVRTYRTGPSGGGGTGYNPFPVPAPLQQLGPPPGSGGYSATTRSW